MKRNNKKTMIYTFLLSCLVTATSCNRDSYIPSQGDEIKKSGDVTIYTTTGSRSLDFGKRFVDFSSKFNMSPNTITLDPAKKFQTMDGFGAAVTGSTCYNLMKMSKEDRTKFLTETFSDKDGMGMNYIRIAIGCSDFSLSEYTYHSSAERNTCHQSIHKNHGLPMDSTEMDES